MGLVKDETRSKRPIREDTEKDLPAWVRQADLLENEINGLEELIDAKESNPQYQKVLRESMKRLNQIAIRAMSIDARESHTLAEVRGQFNERLLLTKEIAEAKTESEKKKSILSNYREKIKKWFEKSQKGNSNARDSNSRINHE